MLRLGFVGAMIVAGTIAGTFVVSDDHALGALMGAIIGGTASVMAMAFPRNHDYPPDHDYWFKD